jgi:hypothetical protein
MRIRLRPLGVALTILAGATVTTPVTAHAAAADDLCNVNQATWVRTEPELGAPVRYTLNQGDGFRITGPRTGGWVLGHGNGKDDGYIPNDGRLYNC